MALSFNNSPINDLRFGPSNVLALYRGASKVWPADTSYTEGLPFSVATNFVDWSDTSLTGAKRRFAHLFPIFSPGLAEASSYTVSYFSRNYNRPNGENGSPHYRYGAFERDSHQWSAPRTLAARAAWMIEQGRQAHLDGFVIDLLPASAADNQHQWAFALLDAADAVSDFKILPMLDTNGSLAAASNATIVAILKKYALLDDGTTRRPSSWWLPDGRWVMGTYAGSVVKTKTWWQDLQSDLALAVGAPGVAMITTTSFWSQQTSAHIQDVSAAIGRWGAGDDPALIATAANDTADAAAYGIAAFSMVGLQQLRPKSSVTDNSKGMDALVAHWNKQISEDPQLLQEVTWDDFSEGSTFAPTVARGWTASDLSTYFAHKWKLGSFPTITRDALYVTSRLHPAGALSAARRANAAAWVQKTDARVAALNNLASLSGLLTIDGVALTASDRVLVAGQTNESQNGIWVASSGSWNRATDLSSSAQCVEGVRISVSEGTYWAGDSFTLTLVYGPITLDTTPITFFTSNAADTPTTSVRVTATSPLSLSGLQTVDGVALGAGDLVLATAQTNGAQNGIWAVSSGAWSRTGDLSADADQFTKGFQVAASQGSQAGKPYVLALMDGPISLGVTAQYYFPAGADATPLVQWVGGGRPTGGQQSDWSDTVQVVALLTAPATVRITDSNGNHDFAAPAGYSMFRTPMVVGSQPVALVIRGGNTTTSVTFPRPLVSTPVITDYTEFSVASLRGPTDNGYHPDGWAGY